jgi:hypothetical protein
MEHLFIPYALSVTAKEKGFNAECFGIHTENGIWTVPTTSQTHFDNQLCSAPIYQQIVDWLDDKHKLRIIFSSCKTSGKYRYDIIQFVGDKWIGDYNLISFYDRTEMKIKAIQEALKLI